MTPQMRGHSRRTNRRQAQDVADLAPELFGNGLGIGVFRLAAPCR